MGLVSVLALFCIMLTSAYCHLTPTEGPGRSPGGRNHSLTCCSTKVTVTSMSPCGMACPSWTLNFVLYNDIYKNCLTDCVEENKTNRAALCYFVLCMFLACVFFIPAGEKFREVRHNRISSCTQRYLPMIDEVVSQSPPNGSVSRSQSGSI